MGWAKYAEDNYEIHLERIYYQSEKVQEPRFQITTSYRRLFRRRLKLLFKVQKRLRTKNAPSNAVIAENAFYSQLESKSFSHHISINHRNAAKLADKGIR